MAQIVNLAPTTETDAVNAMLSAIGQAPVSSADNAATEAGTDGQFAINALRTAAREVQARGWRFNTEWGLALSPAGTVAWTDPDGSSKTLNVFTVPTGAISVDLSRTSDQASLDVTVRSSKVYTPVGTQVFYDRAKNRDGFPTSERTKLWVDVTWLFDFDKLPETARRYITVVAARRLAAQATGDRETVGFTMQDEMLALRDLKRDEGPKDLPNVFDDPGTLAKLGGRPRRIGRFVDLRNNP